MKPTMLNLMKTLGIECAPSAWWREACKNTEMVEGQDYKAIPNTRPKDYELTPELWLYLLMKGTNSKAKEKLVQLISEEGLAGKMVEGFNITPAEAMAALKGEEFEVPQYLVKMTSQEVADYLEVSHQYIIDAAEAEIEDHQKPPEEIGFVKTLHGYCMNTLALHLLTAKLNMVERCRLGGYVSDLNDKAMFEDIFSS